MIFQLKVLRNLRRLASFLSQNKWRLSDYLLGKDDNRADRLAELIESLRIYSNPANTMLVQVRPEIYNDNDVLPAIRKDTGEHVALERVLDGLLSRKPSDDQRDSERRKMQILLEQVLEVDGAWSTKTAAAPGPGLALATCPPSIDDAKRLDEDITQSKEELAMTDPTDELSKSKLSLHLSCRLYQRYRATGRISDLDDAVVHLEHVQLPTKIEPVTLPPDLIMEKPSDISYTLSDKDNAKWTVSTKKHCYENQS